MIYGKRIRLRHVERADLPLFVDWLDDPEVNRGLALYRPLSQAEEEKWFENILAGGRDEPPLVIEARRDDSWEMIGNSGFHNIDWRSRSAEVGLFIGDKSYWNRGFGSEVMGLLLRYGFTTLNLHRIYLRVFEDNPRAIRAYEKSGFIHEGRLRQAEFHDGHYFDVLVMSVLRAEWHAEEE